MVWSEEELTIEIGLFYQVWVCDAYLGRCREEKVLASKRATIKLIAVIRLNTADSYLS